VDLTVLGCSGSYGAPPAGACSGYLVRHDDTAIWMDCGNGTLSRLQEHVALSDLDALVITHEHPDHCVDVYGLHVALRYGVGRTGFPVYGPAGIDAHLAHLVRGGWRDTFAWHAVDETTPAAVGAVTLRFSRTDHPPPTYAVEATAGGRRLVYTADTGPAWSVDAFGAGADLVLSEASYLDGPTSPAGPGSAAGGPVRRSPHHLTATEAGRAARVAGAHALVLTHRWPGTDPAAAVAQGSEAFGAPVALATPGATRRV